jgi:hypothetical protein
MGFLIFSCARTIFLSGTYVAAHFCIMKNLMNTMHIVSSSGSIPYPVPESPHVPLPVFYVPV